MNKKVKIALGAGIGLILLILDHHFLRIGRLESGTKDVPLMNARLTHLEMRINTLDDLEDRLSRLESHSQLASDAYARSRFVQDRILIGEIPLLDTLLEQHGIFVFRSEQSPDAIDDVRIGNAPSYIHMNWGAMNNFGVGRGKDQDIYRSLIKFNQVNTDILKGNKIIAAAMYLRQFDNSHEDDQALKEIFDVFMVRKEWKEGNSIRERAGQGEVSWAMVSEGKIFWAKPGCGDRTNDYDPRVLATSGFHINADAEGWVPFRFNEEGIRRLQAWFDGSGDFPYYGFLIKSREENRDSTYITFRTSEYHKIAERPYLEILYTKAANE